MKSPGIGRGFFVCCVCMVSSRGGGSGHQFRFRMDNTGGIQVVV